MATFILLESFTDQGIRNVKGTVSRSADFRALARKQGGIIKEVFWTQGRYDVVAILEAPNEETAAAIALNLASAETSVFKRCERLRPRRCNGFWKM